MNSHHHEALKLEVSILEALLQRNRCGHAKAKYFQRSSMALRAILRANALELSATTQTVKESVQEMAKPKTKKRQHQPKQAQDDDDNLFWDLKSIQKEESSSESKQQNSNPQTDATILSNEIQSIQDCLHNKIPEILSRIEYASESLFLEIARGFFLPFCTVAVGSLARIRVLLMRLGHVVLDDLQDIYQQIQTSNNNNNNNKQYFKVVSLSNTDISKLRTQFTETTIDEERRSTNVREEKVRKLKQSIGIASDKRSSHRKVSHIAEKERDKGDSTMDTEEEEENVSMPPMPITTSHDNFDGDDIGQAVLTSTTESEAVSATRQHTDSRMIKTKEPKAKSIKKSKRKHKDSNLSNAEAQVPSKKKSSNNRKRSASPTTTKSSPASSSDQKKQKQKKRKKKDFFDDLFD